MSRDTFTQDLSLVQLSWYFLGMARVSLVYRDTLTQESNLGMVVSVTGGMSKVTLVLQRG